MSESVRIVRIGQGLTVRKRPGGLSPGHFGHPPDTPADVEKTGVDQCHQ
jgi:hypothetical protein